MKKMEDENTMVFLCDSHANKRQIRNAFEAVYGAKVRRVNTLIRPDGNFNNKPISILKSKYQLTFRLYNQTIEIKLIIQLVSNSTYT